MEKLDHTGSDCKEMTEKLRSKEGTRYKTYRAIGPGMSITDVIPNVEMWRWSHTPPEQRECWDRYTKWQTHIPVCPHTQVIRVKYGRDSTELRSPRGHWEKNCGYVTCSSNASGASTSCHRLTDGLCVYCGAVNQSKYLIAINCIMSIVNWQLIAN